MQRILLADDESDLVWAVEHSLRGAGYEVVTAHDGIEALVAAARHQPDLVIVDVTMPRLDGWQVCQSLRRDPCLAEVPILFLTGSDTVEDRCRGLDEGADDYIVKPCDLRELRARVRALLRRHSAPPARPAAQQPPELSLDVAACEVRVGGRAARLTPAELDLMRYLLDHPDTLFSSQHLLRHVWGYSPEAAEQGLVRWHIMNLRAKIEPDPAHPVYLCTVPRHGYILRPGGRR